MSDPTPMSAPQAVQQNNRDSGGKYATKAADEATGVELAAEPPVPFNAGAGVCLSEPGKHPRGVRVVNDNGDERVLVLVDGALRPVPREHLTSGRLQTTPKPVSEINRYDLVVVDGEIFEVMSVDNDHKTTSLDLDGYDNGNDDGAESIASFRNDETVETARSRYVTQEEGLAHDPEAICDDEFTDRFKPVTTEDHDTCWETVPPGTPESRVWTQVQGQLADGREVFQLVPGYAGDAINYVITEVPWDSDHVPADIRVCWD